MNWFLFTAATFVLWWLVFFATLPFGLRTQEEDDNVTLGTMPSAPNAPRMLRAVLIATIITAALMGAFYVVTMVYGYSFDDLPRFVPEFK